MEGRLAVELTDSCENSTSESEETDPEEKIFNAIFAEAGGRWFKSSLPDQVSLNP